MVLVVVTIVIILVSLAAYGFVALMQTENKAAHLRGDQLQVENVAASGLELVQALMEMPRQQRLAAGGLSDNPELFQGLLVDGETNDFRQGRFCVVSPYWGESTVSTFRFGVENESTKLNLGTLVEWDNEQPGSGRTALMNLPGMTETVADSLLDWIDENNSPREFGAESDYYLGQEPPYRPANAPPPSLDELLLVKGVTRELLFGIDLNVNYRTDPFEAALAEAQNAEQSFSPASTADSLSPWSRFLTVHSAERNESFQGNKRIFLNQRDLPTLYEQLIQTFGDPVANFVVAYRQYGPSGSGQAGENVSDFAVDLSRPAKFQIGSPLDLIGATVEIETSSSSSSKSPEILVSPFEEAANGEQNDLGRLCDEATSSTESVIRGRVNINEAPREVLSAVPGIDAALVERIVAAKSMSASGNENRVRHPVWLLTEGLVDLTVMKRLLPHITTGGDVARAQIVGFYDQKSPWMRVETLIDGTRTPARRVYYKNLRNLGRGFSLSQLAALADDQGSATPASATPVTQPAVNH